MLNHTQRTLRDYFREPMKRLASLLHDKKYTWDDIYINNWIHLVGRMGCKKTSQSNLEFIIVIETRKYEIEYLQT